MEVKIDRKKAFFDYLWLCLLIGIFYFPFIFRLLSALSFFTGGYYGEQFGYEISFLGGTFFQIGLLLLALKKLRNSKAGWVFGWLTVAWLMDSWMTIWQGHQWWMIGLIAFVSWLKYLVFMQLAKMVMAEKMEVVAIFPLVILPFLSLLAVDIKIYIAVGEWVRNLTNWGINIFYMDFSGFLFLVFDLILLGEIGIWLGLNKLTKKFVAN